MMPAAAVHIAFCAVIRGINECTDGVAAAGRQCFLADVATDVNDAPPLAGERALILLQPLHERVPTGRQGPVVETQAMFPSKTRGFA